MSPSAAKLILNKSYIHSMQFGHVEVSVELASNYSIYTLLLSLKCHSYLIMTYRINKKEIFYNQNYKIKMI